MFNIIDGKGFHLTFDNGYTISVQWGYGNYSDNYLNHTLHKDEIVPPSLTAEVAAWDSKETWLKLDGNNEVLGYVSANEVAELIAQVAGMKP